jgi:peptidoglycan/LPS O-acetylase OafA/YrhL
LQLSPKQLGKDYAAEGLRGLAALNVFLAHFFLCFFPRGFDALFPGLQTSPAADGRVESVLRWPLASVLWNGNFAVAIFFVLSGFVLSRPYYTGNQLETLRDRYLKRYLRLGIPSAASVLIGYALMRGHLLTNLTAAGLSHSDWLKSYFAFPASLPGAIQDATYRVIFLGESRFNPPLWTMKIEFIGSLITFGFYTLMPASAWRKALHYAIAVVSIGIFTQRDAIYYYAFLLGGLLWVLPKPGVAVRYIFLAIGLWLASYQYDATFRWLPQPSWYEAKWFYNVIGAFLIMWAMRSGIFGAFLASPPLRLLGRMSFSVYLTHFFVLSTFTCWFYIRFSPHYSNIEWIFADLALSSVLLFLVAYAFERVVDRSGIRFAQWFVHGISS